MSFQTYLDNIKAKTGKTPEDFKGEAEKSGLLKPDWRATQFIDWMSKEYDLGRGHSMAIWHHWKAKGWVDKPKKKARK